MAAAVHNQAALIASDCGMTEFARSLCLQQFELYLGAGPLPSPAARHALEPVVNLARLMIRGADGDRAFELLETLYAALWNRNRALIGGIRVSFRDLIGSNEDHRTLCRWLWTVVLAEGVRALASLGEWDRAVAHAERRGGVGLRLLDGRQVAIISRCLAGDAVSALMLVERSATADPWERSVAACLTVLCQQVAGRPLHSTIAAMVDDYAVTEPLPGLSVFHTRLGLTMFALARDREPRAAAQLRARLRDCVLATGDGYAAREVLADSGCRACMSGAEVAVLAAIVNAAGLGCGSMPPHLEEELSTAVAVGEKVIAESLVTMHPVASARASSDRTPASSA